MLISITGHEFYMEYEDMILNQNQTAILLFTDNYNEDIEFLDLIKKADENNEFNVPIYHFDISNKDDEDIPYIEADFIGYSNVTPCVIIYEGGEEIYKATKIYSTSTKVIDKMKELEP